jgi:hypothetical protein
VGVVNAYLERRLAALGHAVSVEGQVEDLRACRCCEFRTLPHAGEYDICPVCFWEDDGSSSEDAFSGPNRMTLREARAGFAEFGAIAAAMLPHVLADGPERYAHGAGRWSGFTNRCSSPTRGPR